MIEDTGRPLTLEVHGGTLRLDVHDAYFHARYKVLRQQMFDCHPDRRWHTQLGVGGRGGGTGEIRYIGAGPRDSNLARRGVRMPHSTTAFRLAQRLLASWLADEDRWYADAGIEAPRVSRPTLPTPTRRVRKSIT
jgi:hypothetical protein